MPLLVAWRSTMVEMRVFKFRNYDVTMMKFEGQWVTPLWFLGLCLGFGRNGGYLVDQLRRKDMRESFPDETIDATDPCLMVLKDTRLLTYTIQTEGVAGLQPPSRGEITSHRRTTAEFAPVSQTVTNMAKVRNLVLITLKGLNRLSGMGFYGSTSKAELSALVEGVQTAINVGSRISQLPTQVSTRMSKDLTLMYMSWAVDRCKGSRFSEEIILEVVRAAIDPNWDGSAFLTRINTELSNLSTRTTETVVATNSPVPALPPTNIVSGVATLENPAKFIPVGYASSSDILFEEEFVSMGVKDYDVNVAIRIVAECYRAGTPCTSMSMGDIIQTRGFPTSWDAVQEREDKVKYVFGDPLPSGQPSSIITMSKNRKGFSTPRVHYAFEVAEKIRASLRDRMESARKDALQAVMDRNEDLKKKAILAAKRVRQASMSSREKKADNRAEALRNCQPGPGPGYP